MAQFQVPQFIDTEPKIVGPLTIKQFAYIGIAGMISFFLFFVLKLAIWLPVTVVLGLASCAFAFLKYNGRPFASLFVNAALYIWRPKLYLWQRKDVAPVMPTAPSMPQLTNPSTSKMRSLWLGMITKRPTLDMSRPTFTPSAGESNTIIHPITKGTTGAGGNQMLRDIKKRKREYGY